MKKPTSLHWYPVVPTDETSRLDALSTLAVGAYHRLRNYAWLAPSRGQPPASVPASALESVSRLGREWKKVAAEVLTLFERDGELYVDRTLAATWEAQHSKYETRAQQGSSGGKAKAERKPSGSPASSPATANPKQSESDAGLEQPLTGLAQAPAAPSGERAALTGALAFGAGDDLADAVLDTEPESFDAPIPESDELTPAERSLIDRTGQLPGFPFADYQQGLNREVAKWCAENREEAAELRERVEVEVRDGMPESVPPSHVDRAVDAAMRDAVRTLKGWPDYAGWIEHRRRAARKKSRAA